MYVRLGSYRQSSKSGNASKYEKANAHKRAKYTLQTVRTYSTGTYLYVLPIVSSELDLLVDRTIGPKTKLFLLVLVDEDNSVSTCTILSLFALRSEINL